MRKRTYSFLLVYFISTWFIYSQDIHFSNYYLSPLSLNPANTGNYSGNWRLMGNYRQQGEQISNFYSSASLAFDHPIYINSEKASIGLLYMYDNSASNTLLVNKIYLSAGYFVRISPQSYLHIGLQGGYVHKKISLNGLTFPDQFDISQGYFNPDLPTLDLFEVQKLSYIDLNWGLIWSRKGNTLSSELGIAMFHYNRPEESFFGFNNQLNARYILHGMARKKLLDYFYLRTLALYATQNKSNELLFGCDFGIIPQQSEKIKDFYVGIHYRGGYNRNSDALILKTGFKYKDYELSVAYDLDISGQKVKNYMSNAFEISLVIIRPETAIRERTIPCEVF